MSFPGNFIDDENSEILFFILVFLLIFSSNLFGRGNYIDDCSFDNDNTDILFFIILFLLLFFNFHNDRGIVDRGLEEPV